MHLTPGCAKPQLEEYGCGEGVCKVAGSVGEKGLYRKGSDELYGASSGSCGVLAAVQCMEGDSE